MSCETYNKRFTSGFVRKAKIGGDIHCDKMWRLKQTTNIATSPNNKIRIYQPFIGVYIVRVIIRPAFLVRLGIHNVLLTELPTEANISKTWLVFLPRSILVFDKKERSVRKSSKWQFVSQRHNLKEIFVFLNSKQKERNYSLKSFKCFQSQYFSRNFTHCECCIGLFFFFFLNYPETY